MECNHCHQPAPRPEPPELPAAEEVERNVRRHLGASYQINSLLGRGGMSLVYLAREKELNRLVALKVLPLQLVLGTAAADRFSREAKIAASLDQHHIVPIYRVGTTSSFLWYTMKYVKGRSLADVLDDHGTLGLGATLDIIGQVASALHYAHRRGIVHRDIKPENVLIDEDGWVWVCDFGVAKAFGAIPLTNTGATLGTPSYMSPEQCYGQSVDGRSDQYSLAALIYRCLAGQTPFVANSLGLMIRKQCLESPKELIEVRSDLPPRVSSAVRRALNKKPDDRYPDIVQFIEAVGGRVSVRITNPSLQELTQPTPLPTESPPRVPRQRRWRRPSCGRTPKRRRRTRPVARALRRRRCWTRRWPWRKRSSRSRASAPVRAHRRSRRSRRRPAPSGRRLAPQPRSPHGSGSSRNSGGTCTSTAASCR
jgi:serine/threonine-protein kinase